MRNKFIKAFSLLCGLMIFGHSCQTNRDGEQALAQSERNIDMDVELSVDASFNQEELRGQMTPYLVDGKIKGELFSNVGGFRTLVFNGDKIVYDSEKHVSIYDEHGNEVTKRLSWKLNGKWYQGEKESLTLSQGIRLKGVDPSLGFRIVAFDYFDGYSEFSKGIVPVDALKNIPDYGSSSNFAFIPIVLDRKLTLVGSRLTDLSDGKSVFKPRGTLVRVNVTNNLNRGVPFYGILRYGDDAYGHTAFHVQRYDEQLGRVVHHNTTTYDPEVKDYVYDSSIDDYVEVIITPAKPRSWIHAWGITNYNGLVGAGKTRSFLIYSPVDYIKDAEKLLLSGGFTSAIAIRRPGQTLRDGGVVDYDVTITPGSLDEQTNPGGIYTSDTGLALAEPGSKLYYAGEDLSDGSANYLLSSIQRANPSVGAYIPTLADWARYGIADHHYTTPGGHRMYTPPVIGENRVQLRVSEQVRFSKNDPVREEVSTYRAYAGTNVSYAIRFHDNPEKRCFQRFEYWAPNLPVTLGIYFARTPPMFIVHTLPYEEAAAQGGENADALTEAFWEAKRSSGALKTPIKFVVDYRGDHTLSTMYVADDPTYKVISFDYRLIRNESGRALLDDLFAPTNATKIGNAKAIPLLFTK